MKNYKLSPKLEHGQNRGGGCELFSCSRHQSWLKSWIEGYIHQVKYQEICKKILIYQKKQQDLPVLILQHFQNEEKLWVTITWELHYLSYWKGIVSSGYHTLWINDIQYWLEALIRTENWITFCGPRWKEWCCGWIFI